MMPDIATLPALADLIAPPISSEKPRRKLRGVLRLLALLAILLVASVSIFATLFPGFTLGFYEQLRYSTWHENKGLYFSLAYWLHFMQKMSFDTDKKIWSFDKTPEDNLDDFEKGRLAFHRGDFNKAVSLLRREIQARGESEPRLFWLALSYMRLGESENCLRRLKSSGAQTGSQDHGAMGTTVCTLPFTAFHDSPEYSREAAKIFQTLLDKYDHSNYLYRWLLNLSYMTIQGFPQEVPSQYRIQSDFIDSFYGAKKQVMEAKYNYLSFEEDAVKLGVTSFNTGRGVAVEDFKNDGFLDVITCSTFEGMHFFKNDKGVRFIDQTKGSALEAVKQCLAVVPVDYDNDGWVDLFVCRPFSHYSLLRNNGNGTFTDVTVQVGLWDPKDNEIAATFIPVWADVNNDGKLDLFLAQFAFRIPMVSGIMVVPRKDSKLFINENGHFVDRTKEYGLSDIVYDYYFVGAAFGDYNGDGLPDLLLASPLRNSTLLLRNVDGRRFEDSHLIPTTASGFMAGFLDVNHDGRLDLLIGGFGDAKTNTEQVVFGRHTDDFLSGHSLLLVQKPNGTFEEVKQAFDMPVSTMGASWGDLTNSGCYDFYFGTGDPEPWFILPHLMYMGKSKGTGCAPEFENVSMLQGFGNLQKGHGIVFFDFNNDGKQDIYSALGGMWPGDAWISQFFVNHSTTSNTWIKIRLRGRQTNYFGLGAMIRVQAENSKGEEIVRYYYMDNKTGFGGGPFLAHIGLANAVRVTKVEVSWPTSHCKATYDARIGELNILDENQCSANLAQLQPGEVH